MQLNFEKMNGLIPCIIQDAQTQKVLMLGYMNEQAYKKTISENRVSFYSRSKQRIWTKGETTGNFLELVEILNDCDNDALLVKVKPTNVVCHTGNDTCFNESNESTDLLWLENIIRKRQLNGNESSYTKSLLSQGINKIAQKVGEEAVELVIEAKDNDRSKFLNEAADLMYHYLVLLRSKEVGMADVVGVLRGRIR